MSIPGQILAVSSLPGRGYLPVAAVMHTAALYHNVKQQEC